MKNFLILTFIFTYSLISAQTIINTESLMKEIDSTFAVKLNIEGNLNFGNIKLAQLNNSVSVGKDFLKAFCDYHLVMNIYQKIVLKLLMIGRVN